MATMNFFMASTVATAKERLRITLPHTFRVWITTVLSFILPNICRSSSWHQLCQPHAQLQFCRAFLNIEQPLHTNWIAAKQNSDVVSCSHEQRKPCNSTLFLLLTACPRLFGRSISSPLYCHPHVDQSKLRSSARKRKQGLCLKAVRKKHNDFHIYNCGGKLG